MSQELPLAERLSAAVAIALADMHVRIDARDALRSSPYVEHKLLLSEMVIAAPILLESMASAMNVEPSAAVALIEDAGPLDVYVPRRSSRMTWTPSASLPVVHTDDPDARQMVMFTTVGLRELRSTRSLRAAQPFLVIHPAEPRGVREHRQPQTPGDVIQDELDGDVAVEILPIKGHIALLEECTPEDIYCDPGSGGGGGQQTVIHQFKVYYGDGVGSAEVEFRVVDDLGHSGMARITGVNADQWYSGDDLWDGSLQNASDGNVGLKETDAFSDDDWGEGVYYTADNGTIKPTIGFCALIGDPNTDDQPECDIPPYITQTSAFSITW